MCVSARVCVRQCVYVCVSIGHQTYNYFFLPPGLKIDTRHACYTRQSNVSSTLRRHLNVPPFTSIYIILFSKRKLQGVRRINPSSDEYDTRAQIVISLMFHIFVMVC